MIDSHGKPGIAGITSGVETVLLLELVVVVGVLTSVNVDTEVLTIVVVRELVEVTGVEVVDDVEDTELELDAVDSVELELELVVVVVLACWPTTGGYRGSRWNIPANGLVAPVMPAPTAQPSCGLVSETERSPKPGFGVVARGGWSGATCHETPS
jgi:hypothetical protein